MNKVAVQLLSRNNPDLILTAAERTTITQELEGTLDVFWLPPRTTNKEQDQEISRFDETSAIWLVALGAFITSVLKPFVESVANEAGKDFWTGIRTLLAKTWKKQSESTYALRSHAYIVLELNNDYVMIRLYLDTRALDKNIEEITVEQIEGVIDKSLVELSESWESIQNTIEQFNLGKDNNYKGLHVIRRNSKGTWDISPANDMEMPWQ